MIEYASEIWSDQVSAGIAEKAETMQMGFLKGSLGLPTGGSGASNDVIRAEAGVEPLSSRYAKLRMGIWRRVYYSPPDRLLRVVIDFRRRKYMGSAGLGMGRLSWVGSIDKTLADFGLAEYWADPCLSPRLHPDAWRELVHESVDAAYSEKIRQRLGTLPSAAGYMKMKSWEKNCPAYSVFSGEDLRYGHRVIEPYLDDTQDRKGTRLKLLCRIGTLPLMVKVGREVVPPWPKSMRVCMCCSNGALESITHFILHCPKYGAHRNNMRSKVAACFDRRHVGGGSEVFFNLGEEDRVHVLLGKRTGHPLVDEGVDRAVRRFLKRSWNMRGYVTKAINSTMATNYN